MTLESALDRAGVRLIVVVDSSSVRLSPGRTLSVLCFAPCEVYCGCLMDVAVAGQLTRYSEMDAFQQWN